MLLAILLAASPLQVAAATPDPVLEWIGVMNTTVIAGGSSPLVSSRVVASVSSSVFDAVNGIDPRFRSLHVKPDAPHHASQRAAAIQAAYAILVDLYPAQSPTLTTRRNASLAALALTENANSIAAGVTWGQTVADTIWAWRLTDGNAPPPPPFAGALGIVGTPGAVGVWRPTPLLNASGAGPQYASLTPWVLTRPSQFRLPPPLALNSPEYAADLNEVRTMGVCSGSGRTPDPSELALFWAGEHSTLLEPRCRAACHSTRVESDRERAPFCSARCHYGRCGHRLLGWQVPLRFLAADHRNPRRSHTRGRRPDLGAMAGLFSLRHTSASRVSVRTFHVEWVSRVRPCCRVRREYDV